LASHHVTADGKSQANCRAAIFLPATANAMKGDEEKCLKAGFDGYMSKPINPEKLILMLRSFLQKM